jgi:hypothetical protein
MINPIQATPSLWPPRAPAGSAPHWSGATTVSPPATPSRTVLWFQPILFARVS